MKAKSVDASLLILRIVLGFTMAAHGAQKLFGVFGGHGFVGTKGFVGQMGFQPDWLWAALLIGAEFGGGLLLMIGFLTKFAAASIIIAMGVAIVKVHGPNGFFLSNRGIEYNLMIISVGAALLLSGAGKYSLDWMFKRPNKGPATES